MSLLYRAARHVLSDIEPFSRHVLRRPLRPYQLEPARAILDSILAQRGDTFVVMMARQAGKNETAAQLEAYLLNLFQRVGGSIVKASPTFKPQTVNSLLRLGQHLNNAWNGGHWRQQHGYIIELGQARCFFFSALPSSHVVGATASLLLECDEAQDVDPDKWAKEFVPMAASGNATRVFWGTAWTSQTLLAQQKARALQEQAQDGRRRVFLYDADTVARHLPAYAAHVRREEADLGRNHPLIRTQYYLEEIDDRVGLFPAARQALMRGQHPRQRQPTAGHTYALLLDVAGQEEDAPPGGVARRRDQRRDATALTVVDVDLATVADPLLGKPTYRVVDRRLWIGAAHSSLYATLVALGEQWNARHIVVDASGAGEGLCSFLAARFPGRVIAVRFSSRVKTEIGWRFVAIVESGRYRDYLEDQEADTRQFWHEVAACQYESPSPEMLRWGVWEAPAYDGQVARGHDDLLVSAALTALLDQQSWGQAESAVVQPPDPLAGGEW